MTGTAYTPTEGPRKPSLMTTIEFTLMFHKREGRYAEKAHKVGMFIDMIHVAEGFNPMLCSENGWLVLWKSCGASGYVSFSSYPPSLISPFMQLEGLQCLEKTCNVFTLHGPDV